MTWLTSLPAVVLVAGGLVLALLATLGGRLAVRALERATHRCSHARPEHRLLHAVSTRSGVCGFTRTG